MKYHPYCYLRAITGRKIRKILVKIRAEALEKKGRPMAITAKQFEVYDGYKYFTR
jgi:hypothetical protein